MRRQSDLQTEHLSAIYQNSKENQQILIRSEEQILNRLSSIESVMRDVTSPSRTINHTSLINQRQCVDYQADSAVESWSAIHFSVRLKEARQCSARCVCACHATTRACSRWQSPGPSRLHALLGSLFVGYSAHPSGPSECDTPSCRPPKSHVRLAVTYSFPAWFVAYKAVQARLVASVSGNLSFSLYAVRRVPWAACAFTHRAVSHAVDDVAKALEEDKSAVADVDEDSGSSCLSLIITTPRGDKLAAVSKLRLLLRAGADPDLRDDAGNSARVYAAQAILTRHGPLEYIRGLEEVFPLTEPLLEELGLTHLHKVILDLRTDDIAEGLRKGAPRLLGNINVADRFGFTPLSYAALRGNVPVVDALLSAGAEPDSRDSWDYTPLIWALSASGEDGISCVEALIKAGANVNQRAVRNKTPLHTAASKDNVEGVRMLLQAGAKPQRTMSGQSPMDMAAMADACKVVRYLWENDLESRNPGEFITPVGFAVTFNSHGALALLLKLGSEYRSVVMGWTVLHCAAKYGNLGTIKILADFGLRGMDPVLRDTNGCTPKDLFARRYDDPPEDMAMEFGRLMESVRALSKEAPEEIAQDGKRDACGDRDGEGEDESEDEFADAEEYLGDSKRDDDELEIQEAQSAL